MLWRFRACAAATALLIYALPSYIEAADWTAPFIDQKDGYLDASNWLLERKGFLPVPIIITEPAVGYGGGAALLFFRESIGAAAEKAKETGHLTPPDVYGVAAFATENGTKGIGAGGMVSFGDDDLWRYRGGVGRVELNLDFYGTTGEGLSNGQRKIGYTLDGWVSSQQVLRRVGSGSSNDWIAARWVYIDFDSTFDLGGNRKLLSNVELGNRSSGLGLSLEHDSRDNTFTPSRGWTGSVDTLFYEPDFGGDDRFQTYRTHVFAYLPIGRSFVLGMRLDARAARGDVPFYQLPYLDMRGLPAARYQDKNTALAETELRWNVNERWALLGFIGAGRAWGTRDSFDEAPTDVARGFGFRYQIARALGLYTGVDLAWGPEDFAFYIQVGSAWR
jgi:hypothetical protein